MSSSGKLRRMRAVAEKEREAAEKAKEAQAFTCGFCSEEYTQTHAAAAVAASTAMCFAVTRAGL